MKILAISGIIIGSLILLLLLVLLIPVGLTVKTDKTEKISVKLNILFLSFRLYPEKVNKKPKNGKKSIKKANNKQKAEGGKLRQAKNIIDTVKEFSDIVGDIVEQSKKLLTSCIVSKLKVDIIIADGNNAANAALLYGAACAVVYPMKEWLKDELHFKPKADGVNIMCDFTREKSSISLEFKIKSLLFEILVPLLRVLTKYLNKSDESEGMKNERAKYKRG